MGTAGLREYLDGLNRYLDMPEWDALYEQAAGRNIPVIRKDTVKLLYMVVKLAGPKRFLEIGTGSGYSTLWIRKALPESSELVTLERDQNRFEAASQLLEGRANTKVLFRDAFEYLRGDDGPFDGVFLDSQKRDYIELLPLIEKRMPAGALLFADNVLFNGRVVEIPAPDEKKYRDGAELLKKFNSRIAGSGEFESVFLPVDDGIVIARKT